MKKTKKLTAILCLVFASVFAFIPFVGGMSVANADTIEAETPPISTQSEYGVQPLFGGTETETLSFSGGSVTFSAAAGNYVWPWADEAVVNISSSTDAYYGFEVTFVWTNSNRKAFWYVPKNFNSTTFQNLEFLGLENGKRDARYVMNCDGSAVSGMKGDRWACDHIIVKAAARIGNEPIQTTTLTVYF